MYRLNDELYVSPSHACTIAFFYFRSIINQIGVYMYDKQDDLGEFPPLEASDNVYKYEFDALALVEKIVPPAKREQASDPLVFVTV